MSLKELMFRLKNRGSDTPDTSRKNMGYQPKPITHAGCTPDTSDTPCFSDTREIVQTGESSLTMTTEAHIVEYRLYSKLQPPPAAPVPTPAMTQDAPIEDWRTLDRAYQSHHRHCRTCIAAGRGVQYGLRCGTGAALWRAYSDAAMQPTSVTTISGHHHDHHRD